MVTDNGEREILKALTHATIFTLGALCLGYNSLAYLRRRERHLASNAAFYVTLCIHELHVTLHHLEGIK